MEVDESPTPIISRLRSGLISKFTCKLSSLLVRAIVFISVIFSVSKYYATFPFIPLSEIDFGISKGCNAYPVWLSPR